MEAQAILLWPGMRGCVFLHLSSSVSCRDLKIWAWHPCLLSFRPWKPFAGSWYLAVSVVLWKGHWGLDVYSQRAGLDCESRLSSKLSQIHTQSQQTAVGQRIIISYSTHWPHFTGNEKDSQRDQVVCAALFMCSAPDFIHKFKILSQLFFFPTAYNFLCLPVSTVCCLLVSCLWDAYLEPHMCIILICGGAYIYSLIRVYHVRVNRFSLAITRESNVYPWGFL